MTMPGKIHTAPALILAWGLSFCIFSHAAAASETGLLLSVQDFEALGVDQSLAVSVSEMLRTELSRSRRLRLLEETGRLYRLQRQSARFRDLMDERSLRRLGELLESRYILTGSVSRLDSLILINARVVDSETGEVKASEMAQQGRGVSELGGTVRDLARRVLSHFPLTGHITGSSGDTLTADVGLSDGILPGQELTVAELAPDDRGNAAWSEKTARSAPYRVLDATDDRCRLRPLVRLPGGALSPGAMLIRLEGADLASGGKEKPDNVDRASSAGTSSQAGAVLIESHPDGALVILSGLDAGRAPVRMEDLAAGYHEITVALEGYAQVDDSVLVVPGVLKKYSFDLVRRTGRLTIFTRQTDVEVQVDTLTFRVQGTGSIDLQDFPEGKHRIRAVRDGYEPYQQSVDVNFDHDSTLVIDLKPHPGSLLIQSTPPGAGIFLDGVYTGKVTPWSLTRLEAGRHVIRLNLPGYGSARLEHNVSPGVDTTFDLTLVQGWFDFQPEGMALVPAGNALSPEGDNLAVDSFYIDIHEVTNREYAYFVSAAKHKAPAGWKNGAPPEEQMDFPVTGVTWGEAVAFAAWAGKRLPTEPEWERAARGDRDEAFPWGDSYVPGAANIWTEGNGGPLAVESYPRDKSPWGLYDMVGNVSEWVDAWLGEKKMYRVFRGGSFYVNQDNPSLLSRDGLYPVSSYKYVGFRCARDIHPGR